MNIDKIIENGKFSFRLIKTLDFKEQVKIFNYLETLDLKDDEERNVRTYLGFHISWIENKVRKYGECILNTGEVVTLNEENLLVEQIDNLLVV